MGLELARVRAKGVVVSMAVRGRCCWVVFCVAVTAAALAGSTIGQAEVVPEKYVFPLVRKTDEWRRAATEGRLAAALQIPDTVLVTMPTPVLVQACLAYPARVMFTAYADLQAGCEALCARFNGLHELKKRDDAATCLLGAYETLAEADLARATDGERLDHGFAMFLAELILSQSDVVKGLGAENQAIALQLAANRARRADAVAFWSFGEQTSACLAGRILESMGDGEFARMANEDPQVGYFLRHCAAPTREVISKVIEAAERVSIGASRKE